MIAIALRYLMGWSMATDSADRTLPEWPPHPDRVFMALAAAHFETDGGIEERNALRWLEQQDTPGIHASRNTRRGVVTSYVPVNDTTAPRVTQGKAPSAKQVKAGLGLLPDHRGRQPRHFPVAIPIDPTVYLVWSSDPPSEIKSGLQSLCCKVTRVGHSASLVQAWVEDSPPPPNLVPTDGIGGHRLRVSGRGRLDHLIAQYENGRRPDRSRWAAYAAPRIESEALTRHSVFDSRLLVLRRAKGRRLGLESTLSLTQKLRDAVMKHCPEPVPEWVSGHTTDGHRSEQPHLAFLPLAYVGHEHADGHLLGVALAVPRTLERPEVRRCLGQSFVTPDGELRGLRLYGDHIFDWELELGPGDSQAVSLRSETWTRSARRWATVTPLVFDRYPKGKSKEQQAEDMVARACERIGLPRPLDVVLNPVSLHLGAPHSRAFPPMIRKSDGARHYHMHAVITFCEPVEGPVLVGTGRYRGYGFFRPVEWEGEKQQ